MNAVSAGLLVPGFEDPVDRAQRVYRKLLGAMAGPARVVTLDTGLEAVTPLSPASLGIALTLFDVDTPLWLDPAADRPGVRDNLRFHCGCPVVAAPGESAFALVADPARMPALAAFRSGDDTFPDRAATLIIQVPAFDTGERFVLTGPGIERRTILVVAGLPGDFAAQWAANGALYPAGVDVILTAGDRVAALPRSIRMEAA